MPAELSHCSILPAKADKPPTNGGVFNQVSPEESKRSSCRDLAKNAVRHQPFYAQEQPPSPVLWWQLGGRTETRHRRSHADMAIKCPLRVQTVLEAVKEKIPIQIQQITMPSERRIRSITSKQKRKPYFTFRRCRGSSQTHWRCYSTDSAEIY